MKYPPLVERLVAEAEEKGKKVKVVDVCGHVPQSRMLDIFDTVTVEGLKTAQGDDRWLVSCYESDKECLIFVCDPLTVSVNRTWARKYRKNNQAHWAFFETAAAVIIAGSEETKAFEEALEICRSTEELSLLVTEGEIARHRNVCKAFVNLMTASDDNELH